MTGESTDEAALDAIYGRLDPNRRFAAVTRGERGARIRFGDDPQDVVNVPAQNVVQGDRLRPIGMGDAWNGVLGGELLNGRWLDIPHLLTPKIVLNAADTAARASAMVAPLNVSRLSPSQLLEVRRSGGRK